MSIFSKMDAQFPEQDNSKPGTGPLPPKNIEEKRDSESNDPIVPKKEHSGNPLSMPEMIARAFFKKQMSELIEYLERAQNLLERTTDTNTIGELQSLQQAIQNTMDIIPKNIQITDQATRDQLYQQLLQNTGKISVTLNTYEQQREKLSDAQQDTPKSHNNPEQPPQQPPQETWVEKDNRLREVIQQELSTKLVQFGDVHVLIHRPGSQQRIALAKDKESKKLETRRKLTVRVNLASDNFANPDGMETALKIVQECLITQNITQDIETKFIPTQLNKKAAYVFSVQLS